MAERILVVDDDAMIRRLYTHELGRCGWDVDAFASGSEALEQVAPESHAVAIVDIEMPEMSGFDVMHLLRERAPKMAIILNTAYATYKDDFQSWLADAYVVKSSDMEPLIVKIRELTGTS
ncbi:response regulator [candidate division GN15 bacterium]|nr:response regulator [candidate division GN15 bacterium]